MMTGNEARKGIKTEMVKKMLGKRRKGEFSKLNEMNCTCHQKCSATKKCERNIKCYISILFKRWNEEDKWQCYLFMRGWRRRSGESSTVLLSGRWAGLWRRNRENKSSSCMNAMWDVISLPNCKIRFQKLKKSIRSLNEIYPTTQRGTMGANEKADACTKDL